MEILNTYFTRKGASSYPMPASNEPYVYLNSLLDQKGIGERLGHITQIRLKAYRREMSTHGMDNSLTFLKDVAKIQRDHEMSFINTKIDELSSLGVLGTEEKQLIQKLKQMANGTFDYKVFIANLNMVITNVRKYRSRLEGFNNKKTINTPQLNLVQGLQTTIGDFTEKRHAFYLSQEEVIRQLAFRFLQRPEGQAFLEAQIGKNGIMNIAAVMAVLTQQLAQYLYDNGKLLYKERDSKNYYKTEQDFIDEITRLEREFNQFAHNSNIESLYGNQRLLDEIKSLYGIQVEDKVRRVANGTSKDAVKQLRDVKAQLKNDSLLTPSQMELMKRLSVSFKYNQHQLSYENELVSALAPAFTSHTAIGGKNMATDMLLGWLTVDYKNAGLEKDPIQETLDKIKIRMSSTETKNNADAVSQAYIDELKALDEKLEGIGKGFVFHETTKNYNTLERGRWFGDMSSFSGREMNMFNYLSQVGTFGKDLGLNMDDLNFVAYNLATDAIGSINKEPLGRLMALFAGVMMFDDFAVIGKEITKQMQFSNVENIHLYRLQDTYMPASMFLEATYKNMLQLKDDLLDGNGFTVTINTPTINYSKDKYPGIPFEKRWDLVRDYARANTTIHLHFAANFLSLMSQL